MSKPIVAISSHWQGIADDLQFRLPEQTVSSLVPCVLGRDTKRKAEDINMTPDEFNILKNGAQDPTNPSSNGPAFVEVIGDASKTLLYGYTSDRNTHHVYQDGGQIHVVVYNGRNEVINHLSDDSLPLVSIMPDKRLYAEACDFSFCQELQKAGVRLPFTNYNFRSYQKHEGRPIIGKTLEDLGVEISRSLRP